MSAWLRHTWNNARRYCNGSVRLSLVLLVVAPSAFHTFLHKPVTFHALHDAAIGGHQLEKCDDTNDADEQDCPVCSLRVSESLAPQFCIALQISDISIQVTPIHDVYCPSSTASHSLIPRAPPVAL